MKKFFIMFTAVLMFLFTATAFAQIPAALIDCIDSDYCNAFSAFSELCKSGIETTAHAAEIESSEGAKQTDDSSGFDSKWFIISPIAGIVIAFIVMSVMKGKMKTVRRQSDAQNYVRDGSFNVTESTDTFLYRKVTRVSTSNDNNSNNNDND
ncbi:MAG: hypothetical protein IJO93_06765 [Clostridia bacterium]|nr:hypothetical protein [Clostridia bacterium]